MSMPLAEQTLGILVVDDDEVLATSLAKILRLRYPSVHAALSGTEAIAVLSREKQICVVLVDLVMPVVDGLGVLDYVRQSRPDVSVILMTGFGTIETAVEAIKRGAEDYIAKPFDTETILKRVSRLMELYALKERVAQLEGQYGSGSPFAEIIAGSSMRGVLERAQVAAQSSVPVLIRGETGTGKELLARAIHRASPRMERPFIPVNCAAIPQELAESELFGHRKGSFTGAVADHPGLFQAANGGTMFLDEIIDLPLGAQAKLLRVLEGGEVRPVGDTNALHVDVRVISACNRQLADIVGSSLREDLFFRISTIVIQLPPLRQRREDLYLLCEHFVQQFTQRYGRGISLDRAALDALLAYSFPGNVRELSHILESAVAVSTENPQVIKERDISPLLRTQGPSAALSVGIAADCSLESMEKFAIRQALRIASGNKSQAAELLGLSRGSLYRKLREHGLESESLQSDDTPPSS